MKARLLTVTYAAALAVPAVLAATQTFTFISLPLPREIPDDSELTVTDSRTIVTDIYQIEKITVGVVLVGSDGTGGSGAMWNGDLFARLNYGAAYSVLLNRIGQAVSGDGGDSGGGIDVLLSDSGPADVHLSEVESPGSLTGAWQPDGRDIDPLTVMAGDFRTKMLDQFVGLNPNGQSWELVVSDQGAGQFMRLQQWSLTITGLVPEAKTWLAAGVVALAAGRAWRRRPNVVGQR